MKKTLNDVFRMAGYEQGFDFSCYDDSFLQKSVEKRLSATGISTASAYCTYLATNIIEQKIFFNSLSISYSEFFRNSLTFPLLEQHIFPGLIALKQKNGQSEIRIWSAGCAAGQEAYSAAILLDEMTAERVDRVSFRIFATDRCDSELEAAQKGVYDSAAVRNVRLKHLRKYFTEHGDSYELAENLKARVNFSLFDLLDESATSPPASIYGDFDLVFCSNLLFYYHPDAQKNVLDKVYRSLSPEGYLVTGEAERAIVEKHGGFTSFARPSAIFRKSTHRGNR